MATQILSTVGEVRAASDATFIRLQAKGDEWKQKRDERSKEIREIEHRSYQRFSTAATIWNALPFWKRLFVAKPTLSMYSDRILDVFPSFSLDIAENIAFVRSAELRKAIASLPDTFCVLIDVDDARMIGLGGDAS
jgi:hypothetical protein